MELENLLKQRDAYAGKIIPLGVKIAVIFLVPAVFVVVSNRVWNINYFYTLPVAFILSWSGVIWLYRKMSAEVRALEVRIKKLRTQDTHKETLETSKGKDANSVI
jgi:hypothetical protein